MTTLSPLYRILALAAVVAGLLTAGVWYRASLLHDGYTTAKTEAKAQVLAAQTAAANADAEATQRSAADHATTLQTLKAQHEQTTNGLSKALVASDHRNQRLGADVARLLNDAAGLRAGIAAAASALGSTSPATDANYTVADLIYTTNENLAICRANSAQLEALQDFYNALRKPISTPE